MNVLQFTESGNYQSSHLHTTSLDRFSLSTSVPPTAVSLPVSAQTHTEFLINPSPWSAEPQTHYDQMLRKREARHFNWLAQTAARLSKSPPRSLDMEIYEAKKKGEKLVLFHYIAFSYLTFTLSDSLGIKTSR